jgi:arsenate reductase
MEDKTILIHNPRCSKSRTAKELLEQNGVEFMTINYLQDGLKEKLLSHLPSMTGLGFSKLVRDQEDIYKELDLKNKKLADSEWISLLIKHPILLERPIFIHNNKAIIGRPPEQVLTIL